MASELIAVRHGQSMANLAFADESGTAASDLRGRYRDADVPLSPTGRAQATALSAWLAGQELHRIYCSPYLRALSLALHGIADHPPVLLDERIRDREMGVLELMPPALVEREYPSEARRRERTGELYYRPPGGESLADVALRLRTFLRDLDGDGRVLIVCHDAVVLMIRYITEAIPEADLAQIPLVANGSISTWRRSRHGNLHLAQYGHPSRPRRS